MRAEPCSPAWRLSTLLLGASWVVALAVACGGGGDDLIASPVATGAAGSDARDKPGAMAVVALAPHTTAQMPGQAPGRGAATLPAPLLQPCSDESRRPAQSAAVPTHLRAPRVQGDGLDDAALSSPAGRTDAGGPGADPPADPFEAK
jgi:hypothetical protein